jgi:hypothetical protein
MWSRRVARQIGAEPAVCCLCRLGFRVSPSFWKNNGDWKDDSPQRGLRWDVVHVEDREEERCDGSVGIIADASD